MNFSVNKIIYNDGSFSIAWGQWKDQTMSVLELKPSHSEENDFKLCYNIYIQ
ncbi:hypothetical protein [Candidatus Marithrix sp. Canyon 246]|uniref:hypothetical protein n=1 Tax=Candidatus Marithrix sp. Canyon 246 TaxID=1827136 RepID=UPI001495454B|nr:hypothetical protein [Candidatus Marithrix sp. Canyon 246]